MSVTLKEQLDIIDDKALVKIKLKNADLMEQQLEKIKLDRYPKLENQIVKNIDCDIRFYDDEAIKYFEITIDYELKFGDQNA